MGLISIFLDIFVFNLFLKFGFNIFVSGTLGFIVGLVFNYVGHSRYTFKAISPRQKIFRYFVVVIINYFITIFIIFLAYIFGSPLLGKVISLPIIALNGFVLSKMWVFRV